MKKPSETNSASFDPSVSPKGTIFDKTKWSEAFHYTYFEDAYVRVFRDIGRFGEWRFYIDFNKGLQISGVGKDPQEVMSKAQNAYELCKRELL